jgi:hypothetical protein
MKQSFSFRLDYASIAVRLAVILGGIVLICCVELSAQGGSTLPVQPNPRSTGLPPGVQSQEQLDRAGAKRLDVPQELVEISSRFFKLLGAAEVSLAFDELLKNSPIKEDREKILELTTQSRRAVELYGQVRGFEFAGIEVSTPSLVRVKQIALHNKFPMRWYFTYYKSPQNGWVITNIQFDDRIELLFPEQ